MFASHKYTCHLNPQNDLIFCTYACPAHWCVYVFMYRKCSQPYLFITSLEPTFEFTKTSLSNLDFKVKNIFFSVLLNFNVSIITSHPPFPFFSSNSAVSLLTPSQIHILFYHIRVYAYIFSILLQAYIYTQTAESIQYQLYNFRTTYLESDN